MQDITRTPRNLNKKFSCR